MSSANNSSDREGNESRNGEDHEGKEVVEDETVLRDEFGREISPIPEVAAVVSNTDDPSIPCMTFRFWVMGLISILALSFINQFFFFRESPMTVGSLVIQLISYPIGQFMARVLPTQPLRLFKFEFSLNPGPFNVKEHVLITIMANCGAGTAYAVDIIVIQRVFYKQDFGFIANLLLILTTQLVGYGMAGILRRYLVYPAAMIWPSNLVTVALFNTLHSRENLSPGQWTRQKFFAVFSIASFCYYWIPAYIFPVVTSLALFCYIDPTNVVLSQLTGSHGLGMGVISLDWNTITAFLGSPLITPYWAQVNIMVGFVFFAWILVPVAYYINLWNAERYPILSSRLFTVDGYYYDTLSILTPEKNLDQERYAAYGPLRITTFFAISYGIGFAGLTAIITHTFLYHRKQIWEQWKQARGSSQDVHYKLMQAYKEVPEWWYIGLFAIMVILSIVTCEVWEYGLPWWCVLLAVGISALFSLPIGLIQAVTNQQPGLNILTEFVIGYILPGRPIANVTFKTYGYISMSHAMSFLGDLKLGQYMKIPPKAMFMTQLIGTVIAGFVNLITANWLLSTRPGICTPEGYPWTCPGANVFFSASVIWGVIAPERMFGPSSIYHPLMYFFIFGFLLPIPFYFFSRRYSGTVVDRIHTPVLLTSTGMMPPARPYQYANWLVVGFIFQFWVRRYRNSWYNRFNYILSAALDSGVAVAALVIFFSLQMQGNDFPNWWGTNMDHCPLDKANFSGVIPVSKPKAAPV
ncbi:OPT family small oligopeptide transporter [Dissophora ornata]|nr:OPT family small oligopeptide transporter [Dissophora ornata]